MYNEHCVLKARPLSDVPTAEQIREDMNFTAEPQLDHEENRPVSFLKKDGSSQSSYSSIVHVHQAVQRLPCRHTWKQTTIH